MMNRNYNNSRLFISNLNLDTTNSDLKVKFNPNNKLRLFLNQSDLSNDVELIGMS